MTEPSRQLDGSVDAALLAFFRAIASHDYLETTRRLDAAPDLATRPIRTGASRQDPNTYFLAAIHYYLYAGDTALHVAAAAHNSRLAQSLVAQGAMFGLAIEGVPSRFITPQMQLPLRATGAEIRSVR